MGPMRPTNALKHAGVDARCVLASAQAHASGGDDSPAGMVAIVELLVSVSEILRPILLNCVCG